MLRYEQEKKYFNHYKRIFILKIAHNSKGGHMKRQAETGQEKSGLTTRKKVLDANVPFHSKKIFLFL